MLAPESAPATNRTLVIAALAGIAAAVAAGFAWGLVVRWTEHEWGIAAWAVGGIVGTVVVRAARTRGLPFQIVSAVCAVIGVLIGKYLEIAWAEVLPGLRLGITSSITWDVFTSTDSGIWSLWDLLWFGLAVFTAFRIPGIRNAVVPAAAPPQPATPLTFGSTPPVPPAPAHDEAPQGPERPL